MERHPKSIIFTEDGFFISNNHSPDSDAIAAGKVPQVPWLSQVKAAQGGKIVLPVRRSEWTNGGSPVFSVVRLIKTPYRSLGYVEVQQDEAILRGLLNLGDERSRAVFLLDAGGNLLFSPTQEMSAATTQWYAQLVENQSNGIVYGVDPDSQRQMAVYFNRSAYTGITLVCAEDANYISLAFGVMRWAIIAAGLALVVITLLVSYLVSRNLARPLKKLGSTIEHTNLENLPNILVPEQSYAGDYSEIQVLVKSFQEMKERLDRAITAERNYKAMQTEARFSCFAGSDQPALSLQYVQCDGGHCR